MEPRILFVLILFIHATYCVQEGCKYVVYANSIIPGLVQRKGTTVMLDSLSVAKDVCDSLGSECTGIVLPLKSSYNQRVYALASSDDLSYTEHAMSWRRQCGNNFCYFRISSVFGRQKRYRKICRSRVRNTSSRWLQWSAWSSCTPPCGRVGEQSRYRQCAPTLTQLSCKGNRYEKRNCNYNPPKCPPTLSDVYGGVEGTEGFVVTGNVPTYQSCIRTQPKDRISCGTQQYVTRDQCRRFHCCYDPKANETTITNPEEQTPICFRPLHFLTNTGMLGWTTWSPWGICSQSCRNGTRVRSRICTGGISGSILCPGPDSILEYCSLGSCPCDANPCRNAGACLEDRKLARGYRCICTPDFIGKHCDFGRPSLSCGNDSITISFDRRVISDEGLVDDLKLIHFQGYESDLCFAQASQDGLQYVLSIPPPIDRSCGSTVNVTGDEYSIRNKVMWRQTHGPTSSTVILLDLKCVYSKQLGLTTELGFGISPVIRTLSSRTEFGRFAVDMSLYRDKEYLPSQLMQGPIQIAEGEILYVSVDMVAISIADQQNEVIVLDHCYATDTTDKQSPIYDFISNGCSTNAAFTTILANGVSTSGRWGFRVFEWALQSATSDIYIMCKAHVCDLGFENCAPSCDGQAPPSRPPEGGNGDNMTPEEANAFEELLTSLSVTSANETGTRKKRSLRTQKDKTRELLLNALNLSGQFSHDDHPHHQHVFVSKRITVLQPNDKYARLSGPRRTSPHTSNKKYDGRGEEDGISLMIKSESKQGDRATLNNGNGNGGIVSIVVLASGSVIVYVTVALFTRFSSAKRAATAAA